MISGINNFHKQLKIWNTPKFWVLLRNVAQLLWHKCSVIKLGYKHCMKYVQHESLVTLAPWWALNLICMHKITEAIWQNLSKNWKRFLTLYTLAKTFWTHSIIIKQNILTIINIQIILANSPAALYIKIMLYTLNCIKLSLIATTLILHTLMV